MRTRDYIPADLAAIEHIHQKMGLDYKMLDLSSPLVVAKTVCEGDYGVIGACALKIEAETYLWISPTARPGTKWDAIRLMQREIVRQAVKLGIEQMVAYVPECIERFFSKRLLRLGWNPNRDGWKAWSFEVLP